MKCIITSRVTHRWVVGEKWLDLDGPRPMINRAKISHLFWKRRSWESPRIRDLEQDRAEYVDVLISLLASPCNQLRNSFVIEENCIQMSSHINLFVIPVVGKVFLFFLFFINFLWKFLSNNSYVRDDIFILKQIINATLLIVRCLHNMVSIWRNTNRNIKIASRDCLIFFFFFN